MAGVFSVVVLCSWLIAGHALAQNLSGKYTLSEQGTTLTLTLDQDTQGNIKGTLSSTAGTQFRVEGAVQDNVGAGTCVSNQGGSYFEARPKGNKLLFALIEAGPNNLPDYSKARKLTFKKEEGATPGQQGPQASTKQPVEQPQASSAPTSQKAAPAASSADVVSDPNWGYKFSLPKGWKVEKGPDGAILGHDTIAGVIWVFPHSASTLKEVRKQMRAGLDEQDVQLQLTSQLQPLGENAVAGAFSGTYQRQQVKARGIGTFLPKGGGAFIVAMTVPDKFRSDLENAADAVAKSMESVTAQESMGAKGAGGEAGPTDSGTTQLMRQMAGVYYSFSSAGPSSSGGTERRVTLCPNGTYYSGSESSYSGGAGTGGAWGSASQKSGRGTWRVKGNVNQGVLTTIDSSGKATEYRYQRCGGDCIYIGNTKFAVAGPANCP